MSLDKNVRLAVKTAGQGRLLYSYRLNHLFRHPKYKANMRSVTVRHLHLNTQQL